MAGGAPAAALLDREDERAGLGAALTDAARMASLARNIAEQRVAPVLAICAGRSERTVR